MFQFMLRLLVSMLCVSQLLALVPQVKLCEYNDCPTVSRVGIGALHLGDRISGISDPREINNWLQNSLAQGITLLDTSDVYPVKGGTAGDSAKLLGQAFNLTQNLREKFTIVAKMDIVMPDYIDTSREHLVNTMNWYLSALQTNYVDILLLHFPNSFMNAEEVASVFNEFKQQNKVKYFGTSNHYISHRNVLQSKLNQYNIKLVTNEIEVSVWNPSYLNYNSNLVDDSYENGYKILGWGALGGDPIGGLNRLLTRVGKRQLKINTALRQVGDDLGEKENSVVALAWALAHPAGIIPLIGTTKNNHVNELMRAFDLSTKITTELWWKIGRTGGLCFLADAQCNYKEYMAKDLPDNDDGN